MLPPDADEGLVAQAAAPWDPVAARITATYGNFVEREDPASLGLVYLPETLERLRAVKRRFDPENVLSRNHNITV